MTTTLADKAREGRRTALAALNARVAHSRNVVSIFDRVVQRRQSVPEFHSIRAHDARLISAGAMRSVSDPFAA
jgi:hypothetical protein